MATEPASDGRASRAEQPPSGSAPPGAALVAAPADTPQPAGRVRAFAYLDTESTHRSRQLMGVLLANKRRFGLRLSPAQIATRLSERFSVRYDSPDGLERDLSQLCDWGAVDSIQDSSRASSTREFKSDRFNDVAAKLERIPRTRATSCASSGR